MRRLLLVIALLGGVLWPAASSAVPRQQRPDWALLVITAGPHGASQVRMTYEERILGTNRPGSAGVLEAVFDPGDQDHPYWSCGWVMNSHGENVAPNVPRTTYTGSGRIAHLNPGERIAELTLFPGGQIANLRMGAVAASGKVAVQRATGIGSRAIFFAGGPVGTEDAARLVAHRGIAGAFVSPGFGPPPAFGLASWTAPDGTTGSFVNSGLTTAGCHAPFTPAFAGGPGHWQWSWSGARGNALGSGMVAWAPIGRFWADFRAGPVSLTDVSP